ncbi:MAG: hypothetical protein LLG21_04220, partial [Euryarchaeota archaeon]|nr:hypothetical protein [Euryarchaeota archaeon]
IMMVVHMMMVTFVSNPPEVGADIASVIAWPMILFAVIGMTVFSFLYFHRLYPEKVLNEE